MFILIGCVLLYENIPGSFRSAFNSQLKSSISLEQSNGIYNFKYLSFETVNFFLVMHYLYILINIQIKSEKIDFSRKIKYLNRISNFYVEILIINVILITELQNRYLHY